MPRLKVNTTKLSNYSGDLKRLIVEYNTLVDNLFKRITEMPTVTNEWVGVSAERYVNYVKNHKKQYTSFGKNLNQFANFLSTSSVAFDSTTKKNGNKLND